MKYKTNVEAIVAGFDQRIEEINIEIANINLPKPNGETYYNLEVTMLALTRELCDLTMAKHLQLALSNKEVVDEAERMTKKHPQKIKNYGCRLTPVRMANGTKVEVLTPYFARPCHEKKIEDSDFTQPLSFSAFSTLALND